MKNIYIILLLFVAVSCAKLDLDPYDSIPAEDVFTTPKGLDAALMGAYDVLQSASISQDAVLFPDLIADNLIHIGTKKEYRQLGENFLTPENTYIEGLWNTSYDGINRVNNILANIDEVERLGDDEKQRYIAEAHFIRAFHYMNLLHFFGGVPIRVDPVIAASPADLNIGRATPSLVYEQIQNDLVSALQSFDNMSTQSFNAAFASAEATKAMMARIALELKDFDKAINYSTELINAGFQLDPTGYENIFNETTSSNEIIFEINFSSDQDAINGMANWVLPDARFEVAAWEDIEKTSSLADYYEAGDVRKAVSVGNAGDEFFCNKYQDLLSDKDNIVVFRLAEMYLIRAEALNEQAYEADGAAFSMLNAIRSRAGIPVLTSNELPDQESFRQAVLEERRLEFAFEGHRLFDLIRMGYADDLLPDIGNMKEAGWLLPIPQSEMDTNDDPDMTQNNPY